MSDACPACLSTDARALDVGGHALARCGACRTLFVVDPPAPDALEDLYRGGDYYANPDYGPPGQGSLLGYRSYVADRKQIEHKFAGVLAHVERITGGPGRLLDVGCGPGFLLTAAAARGWRASGIDLNHGRSNARASSASKPSSAGSKSFPSTEAISTRSR